MIELNKLSKIRSNDLNGLSFWGNTVTATYNQIKDAIGFDSNGKSGDGKCKHVWNLVVTDNKIETGIGEVYDWKESDYSDDKIIEWHVTGKPYGTSEKIVEFLNKKIHG